MTDIYDPRPPWRQQFDAARDPYTARNVLGITGGGNVSNSGTPTAGQIAQWTDATHIQGVAASSLGFRPPQGRLTLQSATPVMTSTQSAKTTIYYSAYFGDQVPIYSGTAWTMTALPSGEISVATTDTTKSPAAIGASKVNDWFVWNDAGTLRLGHGYDWANDIARASGLTRVNGIWLNATAITNGPAASRGTYVGTTRSNASSQLDWIYGALAAGGTAGFFGLWNAYNRVIVASMSRDSADSWTYAASGAWRSANSSTTMRCWFVRGLDEDAIFAQYICPSSVNGGNLGIGVGLDTTTNFTGVTGTVLSGTGSYWSPVATYAGQPGLGLHYVQAVEYALTATATFLGDGGNLFNQNGLTLNCMA